jgi:hypothetical protein
MSSSNDFEELPGECFICMEECNTQTKCQCNLYVHEKCLEEFKEKDGRDTCSVCKQKYPSPKCTYPCKKTLKIIMIYFKIIIAVTMFYLISGLLGEFIFSAINHSELQIQPPWTLEYIIMALCVMTLLVFLNSIVKKYSI